MQMSEVLDKLKNLQDVLAEKYDIENQVQELPKSLDGSIEALERYKKEFIEYNEKYEAEKSKVQDLRLELDEAQKARENGEKGMDSIETHREYEILGKQIEEAKEKEESVRKDLQKEEKDLSELKDTLSGLESLVTSTEADVNESKANLSQELDSLNEKLEGLKSQETEMSEGIEQEIIFKFQRIIQRNRVGIVPVRGNVCEGCHMILPAQFANEIHKGESILFCPYCSRILFYEETEGEDDSYFSMEDAGSLADLDDDEFLDDEELTENEETNEEESSDDVKDMGFDE